jgi:hypothetical protein
VQAADFLIKKVNFTARCRVGIEYADSLLDGEALFLSTKEEQAGSLA